VVLRLLLAALLLLPPAAANSQAVVGRSQASAGPVTFGAGTASAGTLSQASSLPALGPGLDFSLTHRQMINGYKEVEKRLDAAADAISAIPTQERDFKNTVQALERAKETYGETVFPWAILSNVSPDEKTRRVARAIARRIGRHALELEYREDLHSAIIAAAQEQPALKGADRLLLADVLDGYKRIGAELPLAQRINLQAIEKRLAELSQAFQRNITDYHDGVEVNEQDIAALPESLKSVITPAGKGTWRLHESDRAFRYLLAFSPDAALKDRLQSYEDSNPRIKNIPLLEDILVLRQTQSRILGYKNFAGFRIAANMARTPEKVESFLQDLKSQLRKASGRQKFHASAGDDLSDVPLLRQYFPLERVVSGTMEVFGNLLGVKFREIQTQAWHPDVRTFELSDSVTNRRLGIFYLDLYDREGKTGGSWTINFINGHELQTSEYRDPVAMISLQVQKNRPGEPALLEPQQVEAFFHEFGHLMHGMLAKGRYGRYTGTNVPLDFVETMSKTFENFLWQPEILDKISGHYKNPSRKLPPYLKTSLLAFRQATSADTLLEHVATAALDLAYHTLEAPMDTARVLREVFLDYMGSPAAYDFQGTLDFLVSGYEAGYYGYRWSQVFAQDIFSRFESEGILNPKVGMEYRRKLLEPGGRKDPWQMLKNFLGRKPNMNAFLRGLGLKPEQPPSPAAG